VAEIRSRKIPAAGLTVTAKRGAIDLFRRNAVAERKHQTSLAPASYPNSTSLALGQQCLIVDPQRRHQNLIVGLLPGTFCVEMRRFHARSSGQDRVCAFKERRMKFIEPTKLHTKSGMWCTRHLPPRKEPEHEVAVADADREDRSSPEHDPEVRMKNVS
jgi:hypothetical protein